MHQRVKKKYPVHMCALDKSVSRQFINFLFPPCKLPVNRLITFQWVIKASHLLYQPDQRILCYRYTVIHTRFNSPDAEERRKLCIGIVSCLGNSLPSHQFFNSEEGNGFMSLRGKTGAKKKVKT